MTYENAPATQLVATQCACCARPLLDAVSVETGMGPYCRKKHGYAEAQTAPDWDAAFRAIASFPVDTARWGQNAHLAANCLVRWIAAEQSGERVVAYTRALDALGFHILARRIAERLGAVTVETEGDVLVVKAPYSETFNWACRKVPGSFFDRGRRARVVPARSRKELWAALCSAFPGTLVAGERLAVTVAS